MKNTYKLIWSDEALNNLKGIIDYLENRWTKSEIKKFSQLLDKQLNLIEGNPYLFAERDKSNGLRNLYYPDKQLFIIGLLISKYG